MTDFCFNKILNLFNKLRSNPTAAVGLQTGGETCQFHCALDVSFIAQGCTSVSFTGVPYGLCT